MHTQYPYIIILYYIILLQYPYLMSIEIMTLTDP